MSAARAAPDRGDGAPAAGVDLWIGQPGGPGLLAAWLRGPAGPAASIAIEAPGGRRIDLGARATRCRRACGGAVGLLCPLAPDEVGRGATLVAVAAAGDAPPFRAPLPAPTPPGPEAVAALLGVLEGDAVERTALLTRLLAPVLAADRAAAPARADALRFDLALPARRAAVEAIAPVDRVEDADALLASLTGDPEAGALRVLFVIDRDRAAGALGRLRDAARFFEAAADAVLVDGATGPAERLDAALATATAPHVMLWRPEALPGAGGWLAALVEAAGEGLASPALIREDESIAYAGGDGGAFRGRHALTLPPSGPAPAAAPSPHVALGARALLDAIGGFSSGLLTDDALAEDLALRVEAAGRSVRCAPALRFWLLERPATAPADPARPVLAALDRAVLARRGAAASRRAA